MIPEQEPNGLEAMLQEAAALLVLTTMRAHAAEAVAALHKDSARRWKRVACLNLALLIAVALINVAEAVLS